MNIVWDTFGLFERLLNEFEPAIKAWDNNEDQLDRLARAVAIAKVGFCRSMPIAAWGADEDAYIAHLLNDDLSQERFQEEYDECAEAIFVFDSYVYGVLHGKFLAGEIGEPGHLLGVTHLDAFDVMEGKRICEKYNAVLG